MELVYKMTKNNEEIESIQKLFLQSLKRYSAELDADGVCNSFSNMVYLVMEKLQKLDEVAYVRFASVYREFKDVNTFMEELGKLLKNK